MKITSPRYLENRQLKIAAVAVAVREYVEGEFPASNILQETKISNWKFATLPMGIRAQRSLNRFQSHKSYYSFVNSPAYLVR